MTPRLLALSLCVALPACGSDMREPPPEPVPAGDRCDEPLLVELDPNAVPATFSGDTSRFADDYNLVACLDTLSSEVPGVGSSDMVFRLRSAASARYRLTLQGAWPMPTALALTSDCAAFEAGTRTACEGASLLVPRVTEPSLDVLLEAGRDYYLFVDGMVATGRPDEGAFTVAVGCGCAADETCTAAGSCRAAQAGDSCAAPITIELPEEMTAPVTLEGSTSAQPDATESPSTCSSDGTPHGRGAPDRIHQLRASLDARYTVTLESLDDGVALGLTAYAGCTAEVGTLGATCVASARTADGSASLQLDLHAGDLATLVVDGVGADAGLYRLSVAPPCVPLCAGCGGADGCGQVCGCAAGEHCAGGLCSADLDLAGNTCDNPRELDGEALPLTLTGDLGPMGGLTDAVHALGCPGAGATGASVRDEVFRLIAPEDGSYTFRVTPQATGVDLMIYAFEGVCQADSCLAWRDEVAAPRTGTETLTLHAEAGDELLLVVDAWRPEAAGAYVLVVEKTCTAQCQGCGGDDGCGGTCGCAPGDRCDAGTCTAATAIAGNTCQSAHELVGSGYPFTASGDIGEASGMTGAVSAAACDPFVTGGSAADEVWRFEAPSDEVFEVTVTPAASGVDLMLYAFDEASCTTGCVAFADEAHADDAGSERIELRTTASQVFYLVVDSWGPGFGGPFTLSLDVACTPSCGSSCGGSDGCGGLCGCAGDALCQDGLCFAPEALAGNACSAPFALTGAPPLAVAGDLARPTARPTYAATGCPGAGDAGALGHDEVWRFVAPAAGAFDVTVTPDLPFDVLVYAFGDACEPTSCRAFADRYGKSGFAETLRLTASAPGEVFNLVVDGWSASAVGGYRLGIAPACAPVCAFAPCGADDGCGGRCGCDAGDLCRGGLCVAASEVDGDTCDRPRPLSGASLPYVGDGDLGGYQTLSDDLDAGTCALGGGTGLAAPDEVWSFVAPSAGPYVVTVTPEPGGVFGDLVVYAFAGCGGTCVAHADQQGPDGEERLLLTAAQPGQVFSLVVDAWLPTTVDRYRVTVDRPCVPVCTSGSCADDGCGNRCPCASSEVCGLASTCVAARPGDTCGGALPLGSGAPPYFAAGDLGPASGLTDGASPASCDSAGDPGGVDQIWTFVAPDSGRYELVATPDGSADLVLYVMGGACQGTCLAHANDAGSGGEERLTLNALAFERLWVVVDARDAQSGGRYALTFDTVCAPQCGASCGGPDGCGGSCGCAAGAVCLADGSCASATSIPGNTCQAPAPLAASSGAWVGQGDIGPDALLSDALDASACGVPGAGRGVHDQVWSFVVPTSGDWDAVVTPKDNADLMLYAFGDTLCSTCLGLSDRDFLGGRPETLRMPGLLAGQSVRIVVDAFSPDAGGAYSLRVAKHCEPRCLAGCGQDDGCGGVCTCGAGALCDAATFACVAPEESLGNTCAAPRALVLGETRGGDLSASAFLGAELRALDCPGVGAFDGAGPDEVWWFVAPATGAYRLALTADPTSDPMLYAFGGESCESASCRGFSDGGGDGVSEALILHLTAGDEIRVVVDTWATSGSGGAYTLTVEGP